MLTDTTLAQLSTLTYRVDARLGACVLPLASICWTDEMPQMHNIPREDEEQIYLLFMIRSKIWDELQLSVNEMQLWEQARSKAPEWAIFKRLKLSSEEREVRHQIEHDCNEVLDDLFTSADYVTLTKDENGVQRRTATIRLDEDHKPAVRRSGWKGILRRLKNFRRSKRL